MKTNYPSTVHDWMMAIRRPTPYRVGNAKFHLKPRLVAYIGVFLSAVLILFVMVLPKPSGPNNNCLQDGDPDSGRPFYNSVYPLTSPVRSPSGRTVFRIGMIADLDTESASKTQKNTWMSYFKLGNLTVSADYKKVSVSFDPHVVTLYSTLAQEGRGMELSELVVFNGKLYTIDDRTGVVYQIKDNRVIPWVLLPDGDGENSKGFKCEWATVKDKMLYIGGLGKEWTSTGGVVKNLNPQWVKHVSPTGSVTHLNWRKNYNAMRKITQTELPGYMIHESGMWSDSHKKWFFLPRRVSRQIYEEKADERRASNLLIICDENFENIEVKRIGKFNPTHGYSSFKFIPGSEDNVIVALKSEEDKAKIASYIQVFSIDGKILLDEQQIGNQKFEGIEFI